MQQVYATIKEKTKHRDVTVCGGSRRMKPVLVTDSHEAVVTIVSHGGQQDKPYFLLKYTGQYFFLKCTHSSVTRTVAKYDQNGEYVKRLCTTYNLAKLPFAGNMDVLSY